MATDLRLLALIAQATGLPVLSWILAPVAHPSHT